MPRGSDAATEEQQNPSTPTSVIVAACVALSARVAPSAVKSAEGSNLDVARESPAEDYGRVQAADASHPAVSFRPDEGDITPKVARGVIEVSTSIPVVGHTAPCSGLREVWVHSMHTEKNVSGSALAYDGFATMAVQTPPRCPTPLPLSPMLCSISSTAQMTSPISASTELPSDEAGVFLSTPLQANAPPFVQAHQLQVYQSVSKEFFRWLCLRSLRGANCT